MHFIALTVAAFSAVALQGCNKNNKTTTTTTTTTAPTITPSVITTGGPTKKPIVSTTAAPTSNTTVTPRNTTVTPSTKVTTTTTTTAAPTKHSCLSTSCKNEGYQGNYCMNVEMIAGKLHGHCYNNTQVACVCDVPLPVTASPPDPSVPAVSCLHSKCPDDYCMNSRPGFPGNCHKKREVACSCSDPDAGKIIKALRG
ncbi:conserved hypothetical protein [Perkinsus marinus ATCC 50983]|uniref:Merozoite surface protein 2 n=1 Tax=Perkinsus marinus (strain ATCC 50983 / TXsc) TaxID=423536 RepID=C5LEF1_PERM5|nr:conserved hypothetical protein [Perkinsus marinus ATCC 50983]EER04894.1 conserved hypothetical protein [Perkinsus marinus ATCC 50983]|eukprot:XP_002773078.1 conserved hypothetical protein [Perkinsus marinus ATCC 50983]